MSNDNRTRHNDFLVTTENEGYDSHALSARNGGFSAALFVGGEFGSHFTTYVHGVENLTVDGYTAPDGTPAISIGVKGETRGHLVLWGVTVEALLSAIEAGQREAAEAACV